MIYRALTLSLCLVSAISTAAAQEGPRVVTTILPLHSLAAQVMGDLGEPGLLLDPATSPHGFTLKPSQIKRTEDADLIYWIGPELERPLLGVMETLDREELAYPLSVDERLTVHSYRKDPAFMHEGHENGDHDHGDHDHGDQDHGENTSDPHLWLSLDNAGQIMLRMSAELSRLDTDNSSVYAANGTDARQRLEELRTDAIERMAALTPGPYLVFHDAYQYFERDYGLAPAGVVSVSPERAPSARHLAELRALIEEHEFACLFVEPQFPRDLAETVVEDTGVPLVEIDPLGVMVDPGPGAYEELYLGLVQAFETCFGN